MLRRGVGVCRAPLLACKSCFLQFVCLSTFCGTVANVMMCRVSDLVLLAKETISFGETSPQNTDIIYEGYKGTGSANVNKDGLGRG